MSKIRISFFDVVIFGLTVAGGLRANTMTTYSRTPSNINMDLSQPYNYVDNSIIIGSTSYDIINNSNTTTSSYDYSNYAISQNASYTNLNITVPIVTADINNIINNLQPHSESPLTVLPIETRGTLPDLIIQPPSSNISTVTTNIPTIQVMTNFNTMPIGLVSDLADPEPSTVLLLVSGVAALGILHRKQTKNLSHLRRLIT